VEHCNSECLPVISGIPQSTVLGPVLFILFIDDIGVICSGSVTYKLFADDMNSLTLIDVRYNLLSIVWCCNWQLSVNVGKCHVLHIGKANHHYFYVLWMSN